jgi:hypothetical protein
MTDDSERASQHEENMSTSNDNDEERTNDWHPLPAMIGELITDDSKQNIACGSWHITRNKHGTLHFYRELEHAETREALPYEGDLVWDWGDHWATYQEVGAMAAPEEGWESETETVSASRFAGWE